MKRRLPLSSFEVLPAEPVSLRLIEGPEHLRGWLSTVPRHARIGKKRGRLARGLALLRTWPFRCTRKAQAAVVVLVLAALASSLQAAQVPRPAFWAEGFIVSSDAQHHILNLALRGQKNAAISWDKHTQQWSGRARHVKGQPVDLAGLQINRPVRVLVERRGGAFVAKRIILLSSASLDQPRLTGAAPA